MRKFKRFAFKAKLPSDSIVFIQPSRQRFIVVSRKENIALKISVSEGQLVLLKPEVELLKFMNASEFAPYSYKLLDFGRNWIITSFASNRDALVNLRKPEFYLLQNINSLVMIPMAKFYQASGAKLVSLEDWLLKAKLRQIGHPHIEMTNKLIKAIETEGKKWTEFRLLEVQLHFDLHAKNILCDKGQVIFIDWEVTTRGLALIDYFDFYRRILKKDQDECKRFLDYLKKGKNQTTYFYNFFHQMIFWFQSFNNYLIPEQYRLISYLYALERTLIYFEKWGEDRLNDSKGIEFLISNVLDNNL